MDDEDNRPHPNHHHHHYLHPQPHQGSSMMDQQDYLRQLHRGQSFDGHASPVSSTQASNDIRSLSPSSSSFPTTSGGGPHRSIPSDARSGHLQHHPHHHHNHQQRPETYRKAPSPTALPTWDSIRAQVRAFHAMTLTLPILQTPSDFHFDGHRLYFLAIAGSETKLENNRKPVPPSSSPTTIVEPSSSAENGISAPLTVSLDTPASSIHTSTGAIGSVSPQAPPPSMSHLSPLPNPHVTIARPKKKQAPIHHHHQQHTLKQHTLCYAELPSISSSMNIEKESLSDENYVTWKSMLPNDWSVVHGKGVGVSSREEQLLKERKRISSQGILSYQMVRRKGLPGSQFLFPFANQLFLASNSEKGSSFDVSEIKTKDHSAGVRLDAQLGGSNSDLIAFIRHRNLWVTNAEGLEQQLTFASESGLSCGIAEYVMQEEFRRFTGYWWKTLHPSTNSLETRQSSHRILFMEVDEREVEWIYITRPGVDEEPDWYRYPRVGKPNATVMPKIVEFVHPSHDSSEGSVVHYSLPDEVSLKRLYPWCEYIVRAGWLPDGKSIWLQLLDRGQKRTAVIRIPESLFCRQTYPATTETPILDDSSIQVLYEETSPYWINVTDVIAFLETKEAENTTSFIIASERTGFRHLYHVTCFLDQSITRYHVPRIPYRANNTIPCYIYPKSHTWQITMGEWQVVDHEIWVDEERQLVYYIGKKDTPLETHLYVSSYRPEFTIPVAPFSPDAISEETNSIIPLCHLEKNIRRLTKPGYSHTIYLNVETSKFVSVFSSIKEAPQTHVYHLQFPRDESAQSCPSIPDVMEEVPDEPEPEPYASRLRSSKIHDGIKPRQNKRLRSTSPILSTKKPHVYDEVDQGSSPTSVQSAPADPLATVNEPHVSLHKLSTDEFEQYLLDAVFPVSVFQHKLVPVNSSTPKNSAATADMNALFHEKIPLPEPFSFINSDGVKIHGLVYKPVDYVEGRSYPTILRIYGGPNVQIVTNDFKFPKLNRMFMALRFGFVVVMIDSRGSYDRGLLFESYIQHRMGTVELQDQIEALLFLATKGQLMLTPRPRDHSNPADHALIALWNQVSAEKRHGRYNGFIDMDRIAVTGWSYGGYLSLMALSQYPSIFKMSLAGAPVTSWELYDTAYTERYMGIIEENREGYKRGSVLQYVDSFPDTENRLLIVHGLIDENVHFKNTEVLVSGLARCSKPHQVQVYPSERHGLRAGNVIEHFETLMFWWFQSYL